MPVPPPSPPHRCNPWWPTIFDLTTTLIYSDIFFEDRPIIISVSISTTTYIYTYLVGYSTFLRIEFGKWFLGSSCQKKLMRSNNFFLKSYTYVKLQWGRSPGKKVCKYKTYFKNSFVRSTSMKRVIFETFDILAPVLFWPIFSDLMDWKMARSKKVAIIKNQFFHARQPREGIFEICS